MSRYISAELRRQVEARANGHCEYCLCLAQYALHTFECEHIIPLSKDGATDGKNLAWACAGCNRFKASRTDALDPQTDRIVTLYRPRTDRWQAHFVWNDDFTRMIGISASGRATIAALRLNRVGVVNVRQLLLLVGKHPPA